METLRYSSITIEEHLNQSDSTRMYSCPTSDLDIFLPQIGTRNFYEELQRNPQAAYYEDDKWDFNEVLKDTPESRSTIEFGCDPGNFLAKEKKNDMYLMPVGPNLANLHFKRLETKHQGLCTS